ncbi:hypothetical protein BGZ52_002605 [Haplosporangium bisporale]|nr:hypothetical protein BGZ52_002605 [Haplosporangium bisporale]KAF9206948.1 hypothetical protein BGZ59_011416 [Podila verticillata]KAI9232681.1 MAG: hypothetical protein BYD32DRAFT_466037 [Podila humilis]KFH69758.1 hypothetical protein MVEG_04564 [Podila verticillata NRRL 6337]
MTAITHSPLVDRLEYEDQEHLETASIESTHSSPVQHPSSPSASSSSTSLDQLPPAMTAEGTTPAPSDDHSDMVSHSSDIILHDEDSFHGIHHPAPPPFEEISRPNSPSPPRTITTPLVVDPHPLSHSIQAYHHHEETSGPQQTQLPTSGSSTPISSSPPRTPRPTHLRNGHGSFQNHHTLPSPFSFFSHSLTQSEHPLVSPSTKTLKIELEEPEIVLMTGTTATLKGTLFLNLQKNTKIKTLHLEFSGRSSVTWIDENAYSPATRHTTAPHIEHTWPLISHQHKQPPTQLTAGQHAYPFSLELPDTLPESLTTTHGKVAYRLTATLVKPGLTFTSSSTTTHVTILRKHPTPTRSSRHYQRGTRIVHGPEDKIKYKITLPQSRVPHSAKVPLQVMIASPSNKTSVSVLQVGLWERVMYRADSRKRVDMRLVKIQKSEGWPHQDRHGEATAESVTWNKVLLFDMPQMGSEMSQCNPSADNGLMKITHVLRFTILGAEGTKRFKVENELDLKVLAFEDERLPEESEEGDGAYDPMNELPSYLTSFTTPRVSFDVESELGPTEEDILRATLAGIHLPTYDESEEDTNSRNPSRDVSRNVSRGVSPERSTSGGHHHHPLHHVHHHVHQHPHLHHNSSHSSFASSSGSSTSSGSQEYEASPISRHVAIDASRLGHIRSGSTPGYQTHSPTPLRCA